MIFATTRDPWEPFDPAPHTPRPIVPEAPFYGLLLIVIALLAWRIYRHPRP
jgi:hypothetical protein